MVLNKRCPANATWGAKQTSEWKPPREGNKLWLWDTRGEGTFSSPLRLRECGGEWKREEQMVLRPKQPPVIEDPRDHPLKQVAELRLLLEADVPLRPDPRRPGFYEIDGVANVYYIFQYPSGRKVMLLGVWDRDPAVELAALRPPAA
jgi:hypothetical protein